jgi:hypothetical protein
MPRAEGSIEDNIMALQPNQAREAPQCPTTVYLTYPIIIVKD